MVRGTLVARKRIPSGRDLFESLRLLFLSQVGGVCSKAGKNFYSSFFSVCLCSILASLPFRTLAFICCYRCEEEEVGAVENDSSLSSKNVTLDLLFLAPHLGVAVWILFVM